MDWWPQVMGFALKMSQRLTDKGTEKWSGFENISESEYKYRAIKNISNGDYIDGANLCLLAFMVREVGNMEEFQRYRRRGLSEMRPYVKGEDLADISVSNTDNPETDTGMIARNPKNHLDQWYVAKKYFEDNFEPA